MKGPHNSSLPYFSHSRRKTCTVDTYLHEGDVSGKFYDVCSVPDPRLLLVEVLPARRQSMSSKERDERQSGNNRDEAKRGTDDGEEPATW